MEWDDYKRLCEQPDHFSRWALEFTLLLVSEAEDREALTRALAKVPLEKPVSHHGGPETDYFRVDVARQQSRRIAEQVAAAAAVAEGRDKRRLTHLGVVWLEYEDWAGRPPD